MRNYYIFISVLGVLVISILILGFAIIGTPLSQQAISLDTQRLSNFSNIKRKIDDFYRTNNNLPNSLGELEVTTPITDPKTKSRYDYQIVSPYSYKLCTEFSTDSEGITKYTSTPVIILDSSEKHKKGYDCILYEIPKSYQKKPTPSPTAKPVCKGEWKDGMCILPNCADSDLLDIYTKGKVTYGGVYGRTPAIVFDECNTPNTQVTEMYCRLADDGTGNYVQDAAGYDCPKGCVDGACTH